MITEAAREWALKYATIALLGWELSECKTMQATHSSITFTAFVPSPPVPIWANLFPLYYTSRQASIDLERTSIPGLSLGGIEVDGIKYVAYRWDA